MSTNNRPSAEGPGASATPFLWSGTGAAAPTVEDEARRVSIPEWTLVCSGGLSGVWILSDTGDRSYVFTSDGKEEGHIK